MLDAPEIFLGNPGVHCTAPFYQDSHSTVYCIILRLTSRRLSLAMRRIRSAQSESPIPDRRLYQRDVGPPTSLFRYTFA